MSTPKTKHRHGGELKRPPRQDDRGIPGQPEDERAPDTLGPSLSGDPAHPQEPIAPDERGV